MIARDAAVRAAAVHMGLTGAELDAAVENFRQVAHVAIAAFVDALPADLRAAVRQHLDHPGDPHA